MIEHRCLAAHEEARVEQAGPRRALGVFVEGRRPHGDVASSAPNRAVRLDHLPREATAAGPGLRTVRGLRRPARRSWPSRRPRMASMAAPKRRRPLGRARRRVEHLLERGVGDREPRRHTSSPSARAASPRLAALAPASARGRRRRAMRRRCTGAGPGDAGEQRAQARGLSAASRCQGHARSAATAATGARRPPARRSSSRLRASSTRRSRSRRHTTASRSR